MSRRAIVIPPAPAGGLGDDGLVRGCLAGLSAAGVRARVREINLPWYRDTGIRRSTAAAPLWAPLVVRRAVNKSLIHIMENRATAAFMPAADVLDGTYDVNGTLVQLAALRRLAEHGMIINFVGFSWEQRHSEVVDALQRMPSSRYSLRDSLSLARFQADTGLPAVLGADLAFLVPDVERPPTSITERIESWRADGRRILGITPNGLWRKRFQRTPRELARILAHPALSDVCFVMVPHDRRIDQDDRELAMEIHAAADLSHDRILLPEVRHFPASRGILELVDVHLAGRMHSGISALSVLTPVLMLSYQQKAVGILHDAGQDGCTIDPILLSQTDTMVSIMREALDQAPTRRMSIAENLPALRRRALKGLLG